MKQAIFLFGLALLLRGGASRYWSFDGLYGQDPYAYLQQGLAIAATVPYGQPPPLNFFWPNGYPFLIAIASGLTGRNALAGQLVSLLCGALLPVVAYLLGRDLWLNQTLPVAPTRPAAERAGLLAGLIIALAGQPLLSSLVIMADIPALLWAGLATWAVVRATEPGLALFRAEGWFVAAGFSLALAITTRWLYGLIGPALLVYSLGRLARRPGGSAWGPALVGGLSGLVGLAPQLWLSRQAPAGVVHSFLLDWRLANIFSRQFENVDGRFAYLWPNAIFYAQPAGHPAFIFPLLGLAGLWGLWQLGRKGQVATGLLLLGWLGPVYLFLAGIPFQNFRFGLAHYLPLVLLTAFGLNDLLEHWVAARSFLKSIIVLSCLGMLAWSYPMLDTFLSQQNQSKVIAGQVARALPAEAGLIAFGLTLTLQHYTGLETVDLYYLDEAALERLTTATAAPLYLLVEPAVIESQWQGKPLQQNFHWLKAHTTLREVGSFPPYTLFKVEGLPGSSRHNEPKPGNAPSTGAFQFGGK
jgi:4-amino-4-deoxy-L-arabinose transferase-like glycosyltransferase